MTPRIRAYLTRASAQSSCTSGVLPARSTPALTVRPFRRPAGPLTWVGAVAVPRGFSPRLGPWVVVPLWPSPVVCPPRRVPSFWCPLRPLSPLSPPEVVGAEGLEPWCLSGTPRAIGTPCDKRYAFDGTLEEVTPEYAPMLTPQRSSRVAGQAVRSRHRSSPRRPVTRSVPPLHAPRSQAPTGHTTQLSSRPARRELENPGSRDEPVRAKAAYSRIRGLAITRRYRYNDASAKVIRTCEPDSSQVRDSGAW